MRESERSADNMIFAITDKVFKTRSDKIEKRP